MTVALSVTNRVSLFSDQHAGVVNTGKRVVRLASRFGAPALSLVVLGGAACALHATDWHRVLAMLPRNPLFWVVFALFYLNPAVADWLIFRPLWKLPASAIAVTLRKVIGNELLMGYVGETYMFAWARRNVRCDESTFGAVKDVAILSAVIGNTATLLMAIAAAPFVGALAGDVPIWAAAISLGIIATPPLVTLVLRRRLFGLPGAMLMRIALIHAGRAAVTIALTALLWHLALPGVAVFWWLVLSALKLVVTRMPFVANRELVFAGMTSLLLGHAADAATLMAMMATLMVATHALVGVGLSLGEGIDGLLRRAGAIPGQGAQCAIVSLG